jgi:ABC-type Zn2+ transport system substrate-binding protein/surface adhesin
LATLLVLSGTAAMLSPTQAFADEGKDKSDDKHKSDPKHDDKKSEDKKHDDKKQHHTSDDKQDELLRAYIDSVIAGTPQNELLRAYIDSVIAGTQAEI